MDALHLDIYIEAPEGTDQRSAVEYVKRRLMQACTNIREASVVLALYDDADPGNLVKLVVEGNPSGELKKTLDEIT